MTEGKIETPDGKKEFPSAKIEEMILALEESPAIKMAKKFLELTVYDSIAIKELNGGEGYQNIGALKEAVINHPDVRLYAALSRAKGIILADLES